MADTYNIVYRWDNLHGKAGDSYRKNLTREKALEILRNEGDVYGRNLILEKEIKTEKEERQFQCASCNVWYPENDTNCPNCGDNRIFTTNE